MCAYFYATRSQETSKSDGGCKPKTAELIRLLKTAESSGTTMRHTDGRLCDTSTMNRKKPKPSHIGRHFIKAPQTMAWSDRQHRGWINSAGLGLDPPAEDEKRQAYQDIEQIKQHDNSKGTMSRACRARLCHRQPPKRRELLSGMVLRNMASSHHAPCLAPNHHTMPMVAVFCSFLRMPRVSVRKYG